MHADSLRFSAAARLVAFEARRLGLRAPGFCSPPRLPGATRTIRRAGDGAMVAVAVRGRPLTDVVADMIEGVVVANGLRVSAAARCRRRLVVALEAMQGLAA